MKIAANSCSAKQLNSLIREAEGEVLVENCCGERYIGVSLSGKKVLIDGVPGNALGAYLNGAEIYVRGNVQDAVGDTMNDGKIVVHGNAGDALGYAMRGGKIYVKGNAGYRAGIHMKQYEDKNPLIVVGGAVGSFLGEYLAGGTIIVLGIECEGLPIGNFTGAGMHGGRIFIRTDKEIANMPPQVSVKEATDEDMESIAPNIKEFCELFGYDCEQMLKESFCVITPNADNPYKKMYVTN